MQMRPCPQCGNNIRADAPEGLCPHCLLHEVMTDGLEPGQAAGATAAPFAGSMPPSLEDVARQFPHLEILDVLGQGGMGIVYKARQPRLDRFVALKILPPQTGSDSAFAERFAREARALARLAHPGIVTIHDFGESDGRFYLLMEFVDGVNLRQLLRQRRLKPEEALQIVPQICEALQYAHEQGVVHRDIKPENILLDKRGHLKIADFGLAKLRGPNVADSALTGSQQIMGTLHYMAPEQMERPLTVDHRADIYSLGVVFYEMLTGELPLGRFAPPSHKAPVDCRLDEVVLRALEKEPERRYQHASDIKTDVESCAEKRATSFQDAPEGPASSGQRTTSAWLQQDKSAAIKAYREQTGTSVAEAKAAVEAMAGEQGHAPGRASLTVHLMALLVCLLGMAVIAQPFRPFAELQVLTVQSINKHRATGTPIAQVFGLDSPFTLVVGLSLGVVFLVLLGIGARHAGRVWRSLLLVLAGVAGIALVVWAFQSSGYDSQGPDDFREPHMISGQYGFIVLGERLRVDYTWPDKFVVGEKKTVVPDLPGGMGSPPGLTRVTINKPPVYALIGLCLGLVLLGALQTRTGPRQRHRPDAMLPLKLQSLWQSVLSLCIGSRVHGPGTKPKP